MQVTDRRPPSLTGSYHRRHWKPDDQACNKSDANASKTCRYIIKCPSPQNVLKDTYDHKLLLSTFRSALSDRLAHGQVLRLQQRDRLLPARGQGRRGRRAERQQRPGLLRARSHCRFVLPLIHFIPDSLTYSIPLFLKRQCDRTLGLLLVLQRLHDRLRQVRRHQQPSRARQPEVRLHRPGLTRVSPSSRPHPGSGLHRHSLQPVRRWE
jgi:hypothetical protein